jgi:hypothetical protein
MSGKIGQGRGFGFEGGDGFDEAGDGEGVANAARAADKAEDAAFAGELDGNAHERGDAGAIDLRNTVQDDDDFVGAGMDHGIERVVKLLAGFTDGEAAVDFENGHDTGMANVDLHGGTFGHVRVWDTFPGCKIRGALLPALHYTIAGAGGKKHVAISCSP